MDRTLLTFMAHPDDAEILCGGLLCLLADAGWKVHIATATAGDCGSATLSSEEIAGIRRAEAREAASRLGGESHVLGCGDLRIFYDEETLLRACGLLRRVRPRLVITHSPADYMIDHEETSRIARASCFNAPIPNAPAPAGAPPLEAIPHLYYADPIGGTGPFGEPILPETLVDITGVIDRKAEILACHSSQREWLRSHHKIDEYLESMKRWNRERAGLLDPSKGVDYAEGYRQHLGHAYPSSDLLAEAIGSRYHSLDSYPRRNGG